MNSTATSINILPNARPARNILARERRSSSIHVDAANDDLSDVVIAYPTRNVRRRWLPVSIRNGKLHVVRLSPPKNDSPEQKRNHGENGKLKKAWVRALDVVAGMTQESHRLKLAQELVPDLPFQTAFFTGKKGGDQHCTYGGRERVYWAIEKEQIGLNSETWVNWIVVDVDHNDLDIWESCGLPKPKYLAVNPKSGRYHIAWKLSRPVYRGPGANQHHVAYLKRVWDAVTYEIGGDLFYSRFTTKNPFHVDHNLHYLGGADVDLGTLYEPVCIAPDIRRWGNDVETTGSRHIDLFNAIRFPAYRLHGNSYEYIYERVMALAQENNTFSEALPEHDLKAIARSVARFVVYRYQPGIGAADGKNRGAIADQVAGKTRAESQSLGGKYGPAQRKGKTLAALGVALETILEAGDDLTQPKMIEASGVSRATVVRHWPAVLKMAENCQTSNMAGGGLKWWAIRGLPQVGPRWQSRSRRRRQGVSPV